MFGPFSSFLGQKYYLKKSGCAHTTTGAPDPMQRSKKTNKPIPRKLPNARVGRLKFIVPFRSPTGVQ